MIRRFSIFVAVLFVCLFAFHAPVSAVTLKGVDGVLVQFYKAKDLGEDQYLMKITGVDHEWADKAFVVTKRKGSNYTIYFLSYDVELSSGMKTYTHDILVSAGNVLKDGSLLDRYELKLSKDDDALVLWLDPDAENYSDVLKQEFAEQPFKPRLNI